MKQTQQLLLSAALATLVAASPAPQGLDFGAIAAAPAVASGPSAIDTDGDGKQTATLATSVSITGVATAQATATGAVVTARDVSDPNYTPYYPALATGYTTDPASSATSTTTAGQPCVTQPEAGTYCGFINPEDPCAPQPDGYGPVPTPDTASAFLAYAPLHSMAQAAPSTVPSINGTEYTQVFKDLNASVSAQSYIGLHTYKTYDVTACAEACDNTTLCTAFNIYAERDPSLNPSNNDSTAPTVWGYNCPNPASMTSFKCTLWGSNIDASMATNYGQTREQFQIVITASDGYDKTNDTTPPPCSQPVPSSSSTSSSVAIPSSTSTSTTSTSTSTSTTSSTLATSTSSSVPVTSTKTSVKTSTTKPTSTSSTPSAAPTCSNVPQGWTPWVPGQNPWGAPENCFGKSVQSPKYAMGSQFFPGPFNPQVCGDYASLQNGANSKACKPQCQMFNAYYLHKNGSPLGTYCTLFSAYLDPSYATVGGAKNGADIFDFAQSWTYTLQQHIAA